MKRYARLVAPEVRILVEVPVASARMILADIIPLRTVKRLPYFIKSIIVLDVLVAFVKLHRYVSICNLVILYCKHSLRHVRGNLEKSLSVVIHRVRNNLVLTGSEGKKSITCTRRCLIAISRIVVLKEMDIEACRQHLELGSRIACLDRHAHITDFIKCVLSLRSSCRRGILEVGHILSEGESDLSTLNHISEKIMYAESSRHNRERSMFSGRSTLIHNFVNLIVKSECKHLIITGKKLELIASETELRRIIIGSAHHKSL